MTSGLVIVLVAEVAMSSRGRFRTLKNNHFNENYNIFGSHKINKHTVFFQKYSSVSSKTLDLSHERILMLSGLN